MKIATTAPLKKVTPSRSRGPVKPPFLKIWLEVQPPPLAERGGTHYVTPIFKMGVVSRLHEKQNFQVFAFLDRNK